MAMLLAATTSGTGHCHTETISGMVTDVIFTKERGRRGKRL